MKKILISSALVVLLSAVACDKKTLSVETSVQENLVTDSTSLASGFLLLETNCFSCHGAESKAAPSMTLIKETYLRESGDERAFRTAIANFLKNPSEAYKIPEAVRQFGMMPKMNLTEKQIQDIVHYLSTAKIEKSDWFEREYPVEKKKYTSLALSPIEQGQQWAMQARGVLGKKLLEAIQSKGIEEAISFCSTKALFLTDSVAQALQVNLKRVSDKYRNPANAANETELALIEAMKKKLANGEQPTPQLAELNGKQIGYYPILVDNMCLKCHGNISSDISAQTLSKLKSLYPNDRAVGYKVGELRGLWVVEMKIRNKD